MTRLQPWGESSHGSVKENCVGELFCIPAAPRTPEQLSHAILLHRSVRELFCIPAAPRTPVPLNPCGRTGRLSDRCILCNPSVVSLCHRSKEESLRLKAKRRRCESRGESRGNSVDRPCASREARHPCITLLRQWPPVIFWPWKKQPRSCSSRWG